MIAPVSERPNINELEKLMGQFEDYFVIYGESEEFANQLLVRKNEQNSTHLEQKNNNKSFFSR